MNNRVLLTSVVLLLSLLSFAQQNVEVTVSEKEMSKGKQTAIVVFVPEAKAELMESEWKKFINERSVFEFLTKGTSQTVEKVFTGISNLFTKNKKDYSSPSLKVEKVGSEWIVRNVIHEEITNNHIDVYALITENSEGAHLSSFFQYSDSVFIGEENVTPDVFLSLKNYIGEFGLETFRRVVEEQVTAERNILSEMENELKKLENKNKSLYNSIGKFEAEIDECNNEIQLIQLDSKTIEKSILENKQKMREYNKKSENYETYKQTVKELEQAYNKEQRKIKAQKNKITRNQNKIRDAKADILIKDKEQQNQRKQIDNKKNKISKQKQKKADI